MPPFDKILHLMKRAQVTCCRNKEISVLDHPTFNSDDEFIYTAYILQFHRSLASCDKGTESCKC